MAITSPAINAAIGAGDLYTAVVNGTWNAADIGDGAVYLQITDRSNSGTGSTFRLPEIQLAPANKTFSYSLPMGNTIALIERAGTFTVRACKDAACSQPYANASASIDYRVRIEPVGDWETLQGNAGHSGYVPAFLNPSNFSGALQWNASTDLGPGEVLLGLPVTGANFVHFLIVREGQSDQIAFYGPSSGGLRRRTLVGSTPDAIGTNVAYRSGKLYAGVGNTGYGLIAQDATFGDTLFTSTAITSARSAAPPVPYSGAIFMLEGFRSSTTRLLSLDASNGVANWSHAIAQATKGKPTAPPAVDTSYVYYHSACCLELIDRQTGAVAASIPNARADAAFLESRSQPVLLGSRGNALALAYTPPPAKRLLSSFNVANRTREWTTTLDYDASPAVANGVVYATRTQDGQPFLHALDETNGQLLWTWSPSAGEAQTSVVGNVIVTRNLVFFSTANASAGTGRTWAVDLTTHQALWSHPAPGYLALSAERMLYITTTGPGFGDDKLIYIKLQ